MAGSNGGGILRAILRGASSYSEDDILHLDDDCLPRFAEPAKALGTKWRRVARDLPTQRTECSHSKLSEALREGKLDFTEAEWAAFDVEVGEWDYVKGPAGYFEPVPRTSQSLLAPCDAELLLQASRCSAPSTLLCRV